MQSYPSVKATCCLNSKASRPIYATRSLRRRKWSRLCLTELNVDLICRGSIPTFHPEYGRYMIESTPGSPFTGHLPDLLSVERDMRFR